jgi:thiosulfate/3-mercaptopyruvate sulfurtransferase
MRFRSSLLVSVMVLFAMACTSAPDQAKTASSPMATPAATLPEATADEPWAPNELLAPAELAAQLAGKGPAPAIFDMGPAGTIKGAQKIGPAQEEESLQKLKAALAGLPKDQPVVVYCGCCPFEPCPNIRPAFKLLKAEGFTQPRLLNLAHNLKADWIDPGYPMAE